MCNLLTAFARIRIDDPFLLDAHPQHEINLGGTCAVERRTQGRKGFYDSWIRIAFDGVEWLDGREYPQPFLVRPF